MDEEVNGCDRLAQVSQEHLWYALNVKMEAYKAIATILKNTGDIHIACSNKSDIFLGTGCGLDSEEIKNQEKWTGKNIMGEQLMHMRKWL